MMEGYLETLSGYINDEDKMVTYKWLSKELGVHVNVAKQILEEYWIKHKSSTNEPLVATVMVIGYTKDGGMRVEVVKEENLTTAEKKYNKIISEHLYSLQKSLLDIELLAEAEKGDTSYGAIKCEKNNIFSDEELFARRWGSNINYEVTTVKKSESSLDNSDQKNLENKKKGLLDSHLKFVDEISSNTDVKNKVDEKVANKKASPTKNKPGDKKGGLSKKPVQSQTTGFKNLFGKAATSNQNKSPPSNNKDSKDNIKTENDNPMDIDEEKIKNSKFNGTTTDKVNEFASQKSNFSENMETDIVQKENKHTSLVENEKIKTKGNSKGKTNKKRGNKRQRSQESAKNDSKKRKRIIMADDSSEESAESDVEPNLFDDSPPRESEPLREKSPSPRVQQIDGKRKVRKAINKTFQDEDGFLVTKKEYVYESASDEEIPAAEEVKEIKKTVSDLKPSNKGKTSNKQTTLMSFLKKV